MFPLLLQPGKIESFMMLWKKTWRIWLLSMVICLLTPRLWKPTSSASPKSWASTTSTSMAVQYKSYGDTWRTLQSPRRRLSTVFRYLPDSRIGTSCKKPSMEIDVHISIHHKKHYHTHKIWCTPRVWTSARLWVDSVLGSIWLINKLSKIFTPKQV